MRGRRFSTRLLTLALTGVMLLPALSGVPALAASGYRIYTVEDLRAVANDPDGVYTLMNDLDLSSWNGGYWEPFDFSGTFYGNGHTSLYADMIDAIEHDRKPYVDAVAGRNALEMILAIYQSSATGRPVKLPLGNVASTDFTGGF